MRPMMSSGGGSSDEVEELGMLLHGRKMHNADDRGHKHSIYRSDSAPPTVEGSQRAVGGLCGGGGETTLELTADGIVPEEYRSGPDYFVFYSKNMNLNPRLARPLLSKEDSRFAQRIQGSSSVLGGFADRRKLNNTNRADSVVGRSLLSTPPGFDLKKPMNESELGKTNCSTECGNDGVMIGLSGSGLGSQQNSLSEIFQGGLDQAPPISGYISRPSSKNCIDENANRLNSAEVELATLRQGQTSVTLRSTGNGHCSPAEQNMGSGSSFSYVAALGSSLSRGNTPDPVITRTPSPCLTPIGGERIAAAEKRSMTGSHSLNNLSSTLNGSGNLAAALSGLNLSSNGALDGKKTLIPQVEINSDDNRQETLFSLQGAQGQAKQQSYLNQTSSGHLNSEVRSEVNKNLFADCQLEKASPGSSYSNGAPTSISNGGGNVTAQYQLMGSPSSFNNYGSGGLTFESGQLGTVNLAPLYENVAVANVPGGNLTSGSNMATASDSSNLSRMKNQLPFLDPMYLHYLGTTEYAAPMASLCNASGERNYLGSSSLNQLEMQKAYHLGSLVSHQKSIHDILPLGGKTAGSNHRGVYGNQAFGFGASYPGSPLANQLIPGSRDGALSPMRHNDFVHVRNLAGRRFDGNYNMNERFVSSLLEEFKNNKTKCFELSEIAGHVVQFSADQYGSRFIQQKLETATIGEKNMVYQEIMPHALNLMKDVFGNYVIQKFFEHGLASQREELGNRLLGHVLPLSLQMYGCRVIQKAIEVVDVDQKIKMVQELDGHVMRCVRDQNGNHVIQKCIECVPENAIKLIVTTFFDQVVTLSTHPYGCRVIQRVLEHCMDQKTQSKVMDEILGSVSMLAQDQYGNYVVQHVLEHGKPHERSAIIKELTGNIVEMSQQKFASNVVEKCLAFGCAAERQHMFDEMLGTTDENEPLQAMMKDQFGNYVVQKVLETCDDRQRELILSRIKVHLTALKKYTYGKHIVARVEKLVAAGERRMGAQSMNTGLGFHKKGSEVCTANWSLP